MPNFEGHQKHWNSFSPAEKYEHARSLYNMRSNQAYPQTVTIPLSTLRQAKSLNIPLRSLFMAPAVRTAEGVVLFSEYVDALSIDPESPISDPVPVPSPNSAKFSSSPFEHGKNTKDEFARSPVFMIHNLNAEKIDCDKICKFCGCFGDVMRVKIMFKNRDKVFVQMRNPNQAWHCISYLNGLELWGNQVVCRKSQMHSIHLPSPNTVNHGLTKDYSNSDIHRFYSNSSSPMINKPSSLLFVTRFPANTTNEKLLEHLNNIHGEQRKLAVDIKRNEKPGKKTGMALIQTASISDAATILMNKHHTVFEEIFTIRVSFTSLNFDSPAFTSPKGNSPTFQTIETL